MAAWPAAVVASAPALVAVASELAAVGLPPSAGAAAGPAPAAELSAVASLPWLRVAPRAKSSAKHVKRFVP